jgi:hypothetical protein
MNPYLLILIVALGALLAAAGWRMDALADERDAARAALETRDANDKTITKYVKEIVKVPGPAVIRERLVRGVCHTIDVPGAERADGAPGTDASAGRLDAAGLAADLAAAQRNRLKLEALQEVLRPQLPDPT